jgi:hypothetical protein
MEADISGKAHSKPRKGGVLDWGRRCWKVGEGQIRLGGCTALFMQICTASCQSLQSLALANLQLKSMGELPIENLVLIESLLPEW